MTYHLSSPIAQAYEHSEQSSNMSKGSGVRNRPKPAIVVTEKLLI